MYEVATFFEHFLPPSSIISPRDGLFIYIPGNVTAMEQGNYPVIASTLYHTEAISLFLGVITLTGYPVTSFTVNFRDGCPDSTALAPMMLGCLELDFFLLTSIHEGFQLSDTATTETQLSMS